MTWSDKCKQSFFNAEARLRSIILHNFSCDAALDKFHEIKLSFSSDPVFCKAINASFVTQLEHLPKTIHF